MTNQYSINAHSQISAEISQHILHSINQTKAFLMIDWDAIQGEFLHAISLLSYYTNQYQPTVLSDFFHISHLLIHTNMKSKWHSPVQ
jgi:hypothetical protein